MPGLNVLPNRRDLLRGVACAAALPRFAAAMPAYAADLVPGVKPTIRLVFTHPEPTREGWPYVNYDYETRKKEVVARLRKRCPDVEFLPETAISAADAEKILKASSGVDGLMVYLFGIPSAAPPVLVNSGLRTLLVDDLYGGTGAFLGLYPQAIRKGLPVAGVSSTNFDDVAEAVRAFMAIKRLQASVMLDVTERDLANTVDVYRQNLGLTVQTVPVGEFNGAYEQADNREARRWAEAWTENAEKVVEPSAEELRKSGAMYVAMRNLLARHNAQGIAVDCLHLFYGGKMTAYPCMGFFQLNNDGLVGACEADLASASTMLLMSYLVGRPGYISDPVIDTAKNQIIYAHCVAPSKVWGPGGPANPYHIRDHSEDRKGAAVRSLMPLGEITTTLKLVPEQKVAVMHQAKTVDNLDEDRACRTKLAAEVAHPRKLMSEWQYGWHRVTIYGDWKVPVETVSRLLGFKVVEEG